MTLRSMNYKHTAVFYSQLLHVKFNCNRFSDLSLPYRKIGQGHPSAMIYINFVERNCLMLHAKFQNHCPSGSGEKDF